MGDFNFLDRLRVWLSNSKTFHHRVMQKYLEKRGWVVFYLEPEHRKCNCQCWLELYESQKEVITVGCKKGGSKGGKK